MKNLFVTITAAFLLMISGLTANAQQAGNLKKKVIFPTGKTSIVFNGRIKDLTTQQIYIVKVPKGKVLSILLTSKKKISTFNVFNSRENESIGFPHGEEQFWEDTMSATDDYSVIVTTNEADIADEYTLTIRIKEKI